MNHAKKLNIVAKNEATASRKVCDFFLWVLLSSNAQQVEPTTQTKLTKKGSTSQNNRRSKNSATSQRDEGSGSEGDDKDCDAMTTFMEDIRWTNTFLPSLTHKLFIAHQAFRDFQVDSKAFLQTVQEVFDIAYPNVKYTLKRMDSLVTTVRTWLLTIDLMSHAFCLGCKANEYKKVEDRLECPGWG